MNILSSTQLNPQKPAPLSKKVKSNLQNKKVVILFELRI